MAVPPHEANPATPAFGDPAWGHTPAPQTPALPTSAQQVPVPDGAYADSAAGFTAGLPARSIPAPDASAPDVATLAGGGVTNLANPAPTHSADSNLTGLAGTFAAIRTEIAKAVVGQEQAVNAALIGLITNGHILLEGVPGTAKTLLVRSLAAALAADFKRVQFTPDLMPGDLTGSLIYSSSTGEFTFRPGPVFTNILLADEINRTPPKTQAALLEAMAEHQVSVDGQATALPDPFLVVATQNPIEYEGTYSLPEAQLDRFLMKVQMPLPDRNTELEMLRRHAGTFDPNDLTSAGISPVANATDVLTAREQVKTVTVHEAILEYIVELVRATRTHPAVRVAVSPRGTTALLAICRAWAWLNGRTFVTPDDVKAFAIPALGHRMQLQPEAELDGLTTEHVLSSILTSVPAPR